MKRGEKKDRKSGGIDKQLEIAGEEGRNRRDIQDVDRWRQVCTDR